jgi:hypothetical protein
MGVADTGSQWGRRAQARLHGPQAAQLVASTR